MDLPSTHFGHEAADSKKPFFVFVRGLLSLLFGWILLWQLRLLRGIFPFFLRRFLEKLFNLCSHMNFSPGASPAELATPSPARDAIPVNQVHRGPILIGITLPHGHLVVDRDGK